MATATATKSTTTAFELSDDQLALIAPSGGRKVKPSIYLEDVRNAIGTDKAFGILVPEGQKGTQVVSQLHKAAKELNIKVKVWNRSDASPAFVGYKVVGAAETPVTEEVPASE